jgi:hypothetical protein
MKRSIRRTIVRVAAVAVLLGSASAPLVPVVVQAAAPQTPATIRSGSPFGLVGGTSARLYASGPVAGRGASVGRSAVIATSGSAPGPAPSVTPRAQVRPAAAPSPVQASLTAAPDNHATGFTGLAQADQPSPGTEPAQSTVAVGPDQVVQIANAEMRITDRNGGSPLTKTVASFFFVASPFFDSNPRVIYDSLHGRFVASETSWDCHTASYPGDPAAFGHGYIDLAVSRTNDPRGTWDFYFWAYNDLVPADLSIGTSTDKLAVSDNLSSMTQGDGGAVDGSCADPASLVPDAGDLQIANWSDALAHKSSALPSTEFAGGPPAEPAITIFGIRAALQEPATTSTLFVVGRSVASDGMGTLPNDVIVTTFTGTTTSSAFVHLSGSWNMTEDAISAPFADPPVPHQPGSPATIVNAANGDAEDAIWQAGKLTWATTYPCTPTGDSTQRDCVRVTQLDTTNASQLTPPVQVQDFLLSRNGFDSYVPGIGFSADGTLDVVYGQSSSTSTNFPASVQQYQRAASHGSPADLANAVSPPIVLRAGTGTYSGSHWGPYVGLAQDPQVPSAVWQANAASAGAAGWATFVDLLGPTSATTYVPIAPARIVDSRPGTASLAHLTSKFTTSVARTFQVAGLGPIPANAVAVTGNATVTNQNHAGYLAVTPTPQNSPTSSTVNFPLGDNRANNLTVTLSPTGTLSATLVAGAGKTADLVFDVTGYFVADDSADTYVPVTPTRLIDSRTGQGQPSVPGDEGPGLPAKFIAGQPQTFTNFVDGFNFNGITLIPVAATAITGNLTVTNQTKTGYIAITPDPTSTPTSSNLNFPTHDNRGNGFTAPFNGSHQFSIVYTAPVGATADVILDVTGYYLADLSGLHFYPIAPGRVMDTRTGVSNSELSSVFTASNPREVSVAGHWAIPSDAEAATGNLTVTNQTAGGYVSITTTSISSPSTSSLNFPIGDTRGNGVTVPFSGTGSLWLVYKAPAGKKTDLILDVTGYFR